MSTIDKSFDRWLYFVLFLFCFQATILLLAVIVVCVCHRYLQHLFHAVLLYVFAIDLFVQSYRMFDSWTILDLLTVISLPEHWKKNV